MSSIAALTLTSMANDQARLDRVATNIANVQTPGYKREIWVARSGVAGTSFDQQLDQQLASQLGVGRQASLSADMAAASIGRDMSVGTAKSTGRALDLSLADRGFFEVATEHGPAYTRRGDFKVDARGRLTTADGLPVLGTGGEIALSDAHPRIDASGRIYEGDRQVAQIRVVDLPDEGLQAQGHGLYTSNLPAVEIPVGKAGVRQGFLENANVDLASEMVGLTATMRHFEAMLRATQGRDELLGTAIHKLGEV